MREKQKTTGRDRSKAADMSHYRWNNNERSYKHNDQDHGANGNSVNFFFTNFPSMWNVDHFKKLFRKFGTTIDVYIARKTNKQGNRFGFVKYIKVADRYALETSLNGLPVGQLKLVVNVARFDRKPWRPPQPTAHTPNDRPPGNFSNARVSPGKSFADALIGWPSPPPTPTINMIPPNASLNWLKCCLIGKAPSFSALSNLASLRDADGCSDITLRYLGGLDVLLEFESDILARDFLTNAKDTWNNWFTNLHAWFPAYSPTDRIISILISGLPPLVWSPDAFQLVAKRYGEVIHMDESSEINPIMTVGRVGILSSIMKPISDRINVSVNGIVFPITVTEDLAESLSLAPRFSPYFCADDINHDEGGDENSNSDVDEDDRDSMPEIPSPVAGDNNNVEDESIHPDSSNLHGKQSQEQLTHGEATKIATHENSKVDPSDSEPGSADSPAAQISSGPKGPIATILPPDNIPGPYVIPPSESIDLNRVPHSNTSSKSRMPPSSASFPPHPRRSANWVSPSSSTGGSSSSQELQNTMNLGAAIGFKFDDHGGASCTPSSNTGDATVPL